MTAFTLVRRLRRGPFTPALAVALAAGGGLHLAGMALIGLTWRMPAPPHPPAVFVHAERGDTVLNERAALLDPSPMFLPTRLNHGAAWARPPVYASDAPPLPDPAPASERSADSLRTPRNPLLSEAYARRPVGMQLPAESGDLFLTFGRTDAPVSILPPVGARFVMRDEATGEVLAEAPSLKTEDSQVGLLRPAVFFVETDAYGASAPVLRESSGDPTQDARLAKSLSDLLAKRPWPDRRMSVTATP